MHQPRELPALRVPPALELLSEAADLDTDLATAEQRVRAMQKRHAAEADRHIAEFLAEIGDLIEQALHERTGCLDSVEQGIKDAREGERELKRDLRNQQRHLSKLVKLLGEVSPARRDLGRFVAREMQHLTERYIAALQEARWMLMAARAELERGKEPAPIASSPDELHAILRQAG